MISKDVAQLFIERLNSARDALFDWSISMERGFFGRELTDEECDFIDEVAKSATIKVTWEY